MHDYEEIEILDDIEILEEVELPKIEIKESVGVIESNAVEPKRPLVLPFLVGVLLLIATQIVVFSIVVFNNI